MVIYVAYFIFKRHRRQFIFYVLILYSYKILYDYITNHKQLMTVLKIDTKLCTGCGACADDCLMGCITLE